MKFFQQKCGFRRVRSADHLGAASSAMESMDVDELVKAHGLSREEAAEVVRRLKSTPLVPGISSFLGKHVICLGDPALQEGKEAIRRR